MEHHRQIEAIVRQALRAESEGREGTAGAGSRREGIARAWAEVRRHLRAMRDTATSLGEDERTALRFLHQLQAGAPGAGPHPAGTRAGG